MSQFRASSVYISWESKQTLRLIAKIEGLPPDEIAENLLSWALSEKYPALAGYQKKLKDMEKALIEELTNEN